MTTNAATYTASTTFTSPPPPPAYTYLSAVREGDAESSSTGSAPVAAPGTSHMHDETGAGTTKPNFLNRWVVTPIEIAVAKSYDPMLSIMDWVRSGVCFALSAISAIGTLMACAYIVYFLGIGVLHEAYSAAIVAIAMALAPYAMIYVISTSQDNNLYRLPHQVEHYVLYCLRKHNPDSPSIPLLEAAVEEDDLHNATIYTDAPADDRGESAVYDPLRASVHFGQTFRTARSAAPSAMGRSAVFTPATTSSAPGSVAYGDFTAGSPQPRVQARIAGSAAAATGATAASLRPMPRTLAGEEVAGTALAFDWGEYDQLGAAVSLRASTTGAAAAPSS